MFLNPAGDPEFARAVELAMTGGTPDAPALQRTLRETFPRAIVRPRGLSNEPYAVWYVYRDGHWVPSG